MRNLEHKIGDIMREKLQIDIETEDKKSIKVSKKSIEKYLNKPVFDF